MSTKLLLVFSLALSVLNYVLGSIWISGWCAAWHGWRNGRVDGGHAPKGAAQAEIARAYVAMTRERKVLQ